MSDFHWASAAVFACLTTSFFTIARTGGFTVPSLTSFRNDPSTHVKIRDIRYDQDRNSCKTSTTGEDVYWAVQSGLADPQAALQQHLTANQPLPSAALFSWRHPGGLRPLTKSAFLTCLQSASDQLGTGALKGHGIRIGRTLKYLLRGVPFDNVKTMGHWSMVLAPYLQDTPVLEPFMHYAMPPL
ncbi:hypothetical protein P692DRAFT_201842554 [Suillus brevipes Sb2]|nr:hypothetical protein P692DRAFT_201842554 [Suillus brevipes Sb2]